MTKPSGKNRSSSDKGSVWQDIPVNDNICGMGLVALDAAANDNGTGYDTGLDPREIGVTVTECRGYDEGADEGQITERRVASRLALDFSDPRSGRRGFLAEEVEEEE